MMDKDKLYRFFQGEATLQEEMEIREWMERSPENRKIFFRERKLFDTILLLHNPEKTFRSVPLIRRIGSRLPVRTLLQTAATVAITVLISFWVWGQAPLPPAEMLSLEVPAGQRIQFTLPDGSNVWLNSRSRIEYPGIFTRETREVHLDGEAYFEVSHQPDKPFIVHTAYGEIEVLGTTFNVEAYSQEQTFITSLIEGSVQVKHEDETILLQPRQIARLEGGEWKVSALRDLNSYRWKEGLISFNDEPFEYILRKFEKYYNVEICLHPGTNTHMRYTGKFRQEDGIDKALSILQKDIRFTYQRDPNQPLIHIK